MDKAINKNDSGQNCIFGRFYVVRITLFPYCQKALALCIVFPLESDG